MMEALKERILEDDYPMRIGYLYVVGVPSGEDVVIQSEISGTVEHYKMLQKYPVQVKNCDIAGRDLWAFAIQ